MRTIRVSDNTHSMLNKMKTFFEDYLEKSEGIRPRLSFDQVIVKLCRINENVWNYLSEPVEEAQKHG